MEKETLRSDLRKRRLLLSKEKVLELSGQVFNNAVKIRELNLAKTVAAYLPVQNEVDTKQIIEWLWQGKKTVCVPVVQGMAMQFAKITPDSNFKKNHVGVDEPADPVFVNETEIDLFLVPVVAFSKDGHRVGSGKGFYDRFFSKHAIRAKKIGLGFGFQLVEKIKVHKNDIAMDYILTEKSTIAIK